MSIHKLRKSQTVKKYVNLFLQGQIWKPENIFSQNKKCYKNRYKFIFRYKCKKLSNSSLPFPIFKGFYTKHAVFWLKMRKNLAWIWRRRMGTRATSRLIPIIHVPIPLLIPTCYSCTHIDTRYVQGYCNLLWQTLRIGHPCKKKFF